MKPIAIPIRISTMGGKMTGFQSLNVNTKTNSFCQRQQAAGVAVCERCYSQRALTSYRSKAAARFEMNQVALRHPHPLPGNHIPWINASVFRLFSHGDVEDTNMARNVLQIVRTFPNTLFVAWSKHIAAWNEAIRLDGKPDNLRLVYSHASLDTVRDTPPAGWDKVFNVTRDTDHPRINCTGSCATCMTCYDRGNQDPFILEALK